MAHLPNDDSIRNELRSLIRKEEQRVLSTFPTGRRFAVMELARAMEDFAIRYGFRTEGSPEEQDLDDLYERGWNRALGMFLDESCEERGVPLTPSNGELQIWADATLQHCGRIGQCEMVLHLWESGLAEVAEVTDTEIGFTLVPGRIGIELAEREHFSWLKELIIEQQKPELDRLTKRQAAIARAMAGLVRSWRNHYIAYETTPAIDSYFEGLGILHARTLLGQDSFPGHALFGGHEFDLYRATAGILAGIALKHRNFCYVLLNKQPEIERRNIFAIPHPIEGMAQDFAFALGIDSAMAKQALESLTLTVDNKTHHCASSSAGYYAPLVTVGREHVLLSTLGCLDSPFYFMLGELRRRYRADWDRATNLREEVFRRELYHLFPLPHMLKIGRSMLVKANGQTVTDVDALVLDRKAGMLGLFQLKWQDPFGGSLRQRSSRKKNFLSGANGWVESVDRWIKSRDLVEVGQALGMKHTDASRIKHIRLFVIGRNFSNFSGNDIPDQRAAWGLWPQVLRLVHDKLGDSNPVDALFGALREDAPALGSLTWTSEDRTQIHLGGKTITLDPPILS